MVWQLNVCLYGCDRFNLHPRFKFYCRWHTENGTPLDILGNLSGHITGLERFESLLQYMLSCSCEFLTFYLVSQEWFDCATAGLHQGSTKNFLKHIFSLFDTPHKADIHHCVSALSSHKLPVIKPLILTKRVQGRSSWLKHLIERVSINSMPRGIYTCSFQNELGSNDYASSRAQELFFCYI